ncbi:hypothetical protein AB834_05965 [PVC group bacterium (ex Bugula neritina AB1)]|nr:hypothetical protein AB834_05965 [PVC group bacterium (ex Bugula neritina AB1)]
MLFEKNGFHFLPAKGLVIREVLNVFHFVSSRFFIRGFLAFFVFFPMLMCFSFELVASSKSVKEKEYPYSLHQVEISPLTSTEEKRRFSLKNVIRIDRRTGQSEILEVSRVGHRIVYRWVSIEKDRSHPKRVRADQKAWEL